MATNRPIQGALYKEPRTEQAQTELSTQPAQSHTQNLTQSQAKRLLNEHIANSPWPQTDLYKEPRTEQAKTEPRTEPVHSHAES